MGTCRDTADVGEHGDVARIVYSGGFYLLPPQIPCVRQHWPVYALAVGLLC